MMGKGFREGCALFTMYSGAQALFCCCSWFWFEVEELLPTEFRRILFEIANKIPHVFRARINGDDVVAVGQKKYRSLAHTNLWQINGDIICAMVDLD